ncbi:hypothetical protein V1292_004434 [Bradyrhizobium sp. AZCC 1719]
MAQIETIFSIKVDFPQRLISHQEMQATSFLEMQATSVQEM